MQTTGRNPTKIWNINNIHWLIRWRKETEGNIKIKGNTTLRDLFFISYGLKLLGAIFLIN